MQNRIEVHPDERKRRHLYLWYLDSAEEQVERIEHMVKTFHRKDAWQVVQVPIVLQEIADKLGGILQAIKEESVDGKSIANDAT